MGSDRKHSGRGITIQDLSRHLVCSRGSIPNTQGALSTIRFAREQKLPFLGTCGGFQHALLEYARNALGIVDAAHAEIDPEGTQVLIAPLKCS